MWRNSFLAGVTLSCSSLWAQVPEPFTADQMRDDLAYLRDTWINLDLSFDDNERRQFHSIIDEALDRVDDLTPVEFGLEVSRAVAVSRNAHTSVNLFGLRNFLPIRVWWFSDGLHIVEAHPEYSELIGSRIDKIGDYTAEQALARLSPFISGTDEYIRFLSISHLISLESLEHSGVITSLNETTLTLELNGERHTVTLGPQLGDGPPAGGPGVPIPSPNSNLERWPHVLDRAEAPPPSFRGPLEDVMYTWLGESDEVLYIRNEGTASAGDMRLDDKLLALLSTEIAPKRPNNVIVDLRLNTGGNFFLTVIFAQSLPKLIPEDGRIFVLVGNPTLSAAIATAMILKGNGGEKVSFIGERMGDNAQFWAENPTAHLPHSGISTRYSTGFHDWSGNCRANQHCFWGTEVFATPGLSLFPDVEIGLSFEDYAAGRDTVLETALSLAE